MSSQGEATIINHFSHKHPLQLTNYQPLQNLQLNQAVCSGCKLNIASGCVYSCKTCNYFLHVKCSKMPEKITHQFHNIHAFSLLSKPKYPNGKFTCDACGKRGHGFSYPCKECNLDLHMLCATIPSSRRHVSHHHCLNLTFESPYPDKIFCCKICNGVGSTPWFYRCHFCNFDVHLDCISAPMQNPIRQVPFQQAATITSRSPPEQQVQPFGPQYMAAMPPMPNFMPVMSPFNQGFQAPFMSLGAIQNNNMMQSNMMALQTLQLLLANSRQPSLNQEILAAMMNGAGNGIGSAGASSLLQLFTGGNGGGGGGLDMLQGLLGGGGGIGIPGLDGLGGLDGLLGGLGGLGGFGFF